MSVSFIYIPWNSNRNVFFSVDAVVCRYNPCTYARLLPCTVLRRRIVLIFDDNCDGPLIECNWFNGDSWVLRFREQKTSENRCSTVYLGRSLFPAGLSSVKDPGLGFENAVDSPCNVNVATSTISLFNLLYVYTVYSTFVETSSKTTAYPAYNNGGGGGLTLRYFNKKVLHCYHPVSHRPNFSNIL